MSIVTLKRKTQAKYNNMSVGSTNGFSLNGTLRSQGYVGQTSLSRSLPSTPMKGNVPRGHGGCSGTFLKTPIVQSAVWSLNDPTVVKPSVLGTSGMLATKYRWITRPFPYAVVKPDDNRNNNSQSDYIAKKTKSTIHKVGECTTQNTEKRATCANSDIHHVKQNNCTSYAKPASDYVAMSSGEHLQKLHDKCTENDVVYVAHATERTPLPGN